MEADHRASPPKAHRSHKVEEKRFVDADGVDVVHRTEEVVRHPCQSRDAATPIDGTRLV